MTEDEAKTKWCPFVNHYNALHDPCGNSLACTGEPRGDHFFACIGSACMAWRQTHVRRTFMAQAHGKHSDWEEWNWDPRTKKDYAHLPTKEGVVEPHGFCGLAGKP